MMNPARNRVEIRQCEASSAKFGRSCRPRSPLQGACSAPWGVACARVCKGDGAAKQNGARPILSMVE